ncbi:hypothetical protein D3C80_2139770 [compost metagenome]
MQSNSNDQLRCPHGLEAVDEFSTGDQASQVIILGDSQKFCFVSPPGGYVSGNNAAYKSDVLLTALSNSF